MSIANFFWVYMRKPVIRSDFSRSIEDESTERISGICIRIHTPIAFFKIFVHCFSNLNNHITIFPAFCAFLTIQNIRFRHLIVSFFDKNFLDNILNIFHLWNGSIHSFGKSFNNFLGNYRNIRKILSSN